MSILKPLMTAVTLSLLLTHCSTHHLDIPQGNHLASRDIQELHPGMTKKEVVQLLGTAQIQDPFHPDRWDYLQYLAKDRQTRTLGHIILYFKGNRLERIETPLPPEE
ncbi:MAG: outer membrane protein assembly factor BamE [Gammaproteobacteria bacterium]|nr:MAG: outer membrane protein assembly factor BamE [Gammaproteobacteria bacterium]